MRSGWFHHFMEVFDYFSLGSFKSHSLPAPTGNTKRGPDPTSGRWLSLCSLYHSGRQESKAGEGTRTERKACYMGQRQRKWLLRWREWEWEGVISRGHSDDKRVTSQVSRNGQRSLHSKKEQPNSAATQQRNGLPQVAGPQPHLC